MIFSIADHIEQIKAGTKTQTRRVSNKYQEGKLYSVQPCRTCKGIPEGRIFIGEKWREHKIHTELPSNSLARKWMELEAGCPISKLNAKAEGRYTPEEYESLYEKMYPGWEERWAYRFSFFTVDELIECGVKPIKMAEKTCNEFGVTEKMQVITMYCTGCKQMRFSRERGFTCGYNWDEVSSLASDKTRVICTSPHESDRECEYKSFENGCTLKGECNWQNFTQNSDKSGVKP